MIISRHLSVLFFIVVASASCAQEVRHEKPTEAVKSRIVTLQLREQQPSVASNLESAKTPPVVKVTSERRRRLASEDQIKGVRPGYLKEVSLDFSNVEALTQAAFSPGLGEGFVPQGLAIQGGRMYLSGYIETDAHEKPVCRLYTMNAQTFAVLEIGSLPPSCNHAGGLAVTDAGTIVVSDNIRLFVRNRSGLRGKKSVISPLRELSLSKPMKGTFVTAKNGRIYLGSYLKDEDVTRVFVFPESALEKKRISLHDVIDAFDVPVKSQGAVFSQDGYLWTSSQAKGFNYLNKVDINTRETVARYRMVRGLQGLAQDDKGLLWSVSESGALKYRDWSQKFPAVFQFDPNTLDSAR